MKYAKIVMSVQLPQPLADYINAYQNKNGLTRTAALTRLLAKACGWDENHFNEDLNKAIQPRSVTALTPIISDPKATQLPDSLEELKAFPNRADWIYALLLAPHATYWDEQHLKPKTDEDRQLLRTMRKQYAIDLP